MSDKTEGRAWFAILAGIPAILAWAAYGLAWLIGPHLVTPPDPLLWAGYTAGGYYLVLLALTVGPLVFLGL